MIVAGSCCNDRSFSQILNVFVILVNVLVTKLDIISYFAQFPSGNVNIIFVTYLVHI